MKGGNFPLPRVPLNAFLSYEKYESIKGNGPSVRWDMIESGSIKYSSDLNMVRTEFNTMHNGEVTDISGSIDDRDSHKYLEYSKFSRQCAPKNVQRKGSVRQELESLFTSGSYEGVGACYFDNSSNRYHKLQINSGDGTDFYFYHEKTLALTWSHKFEGENQYKYYYGNGYTPKNFLVTEIKLDLCNKVSFLN